jgi:hypothetical protein
MKRYEPRDGKGLIEVIYETLWLGNLSKRQLACYYGVHSETLAQWISGINKPRAHNILKIKTVHRMIYRSTRDLLNAEYKGFKIKANDYFKP